MAKARTYHRNKLGQFAKGGAITMKSSSGTGGGSSVVLSADALGSKSGMVRAISGGTKSSGSSSASLAIPVDGFTSAKSSKRIDR